MQITVTVKDGATNIDMAHALRYQANLLEGKMTGKDAAKNTASTDDVGTATPAKKASQGYSKATQTKKSSPVIEDEFLDTDESEEFEASTDDGFEDAGEEAETSEPLTKKQKQTLGDACKTWIKKRQAKGDTTARVKVVKMLKKAFGTESIDDLTQSQFEDAMALVGGV